MWNGKCHLCIFEKHKTTACIVYGCCRYSRKYIFLSRKNIYSKKMSRLPQRWKAGEKMGTIFSHIYNILYLLEGECTCVEKFRSKRVQIFTST